VCFYGKLNVLLPGCYWLLYRAALLNDICTNTAPRGWRNSGFSEINSSLSNMKLPVDQVLYDLTPHRLINSYRPYRGAWHYTLQSKDVRSTLLRYTSGYYVNFQTTLIANISPRWLIVAGNYFECTQQPRLLLLSATHNYSELSYNEYSTKKVKIFGSYYLSKSNIFIPSKRLFLIRFRVFENI
jgi:hypothetical protein